MLDIEERGDAVVLHMRQVPVNVLNVATLGRLAAAIDYVDGSRGLVLTGFQGTFGVGGLPRKGGDDAPDAAPLRAAEHRVLRALIERPGPVIAAINGDALDAGFLLAAACDTRLMSGGRVGITDSAVMTCGARNLVASAAGPVTGWRLCDGRLRSAREAAAAGFVGRSTTPCRLLDEAIDSAAAPAPA